MSDDVSKVDTEVKPEPEVKPVPEVKGGKQAPKTQAVRMIRSVYGRMVDPHTGVEYSTVAKEFDTPSTWIDSQVAAKKMIIE